MEEKTIYLNGSFVPESEAKVSILDSGFNAGDGVYDVTRTFAHKPFKLREHTERLYRSLNYTRIQCPLSMDEMERLTLEVLEKNKRFLGRDDDYAIWQVVTRGVRLSEANRVKGQATVAIYCVNVGFESFARHFVEGARLVIPSTRRTPPQSLEPKAKITNKMNHNMALFEARQVDPKAIPLMLDINGNLSETNSANFFLVIKGVLCTPTNKNVLGGITRETLLSMANDLGIEVMEGDFTPYDLYNAEEAFLAGTSPTIGPVQSVNGLKIGSTVPGPVTFRLITAWSHMVGVDIVAQALNHLGPEERAKLLKAWEERRAAA
ncbi:MAG TPA: aminotransferase class IV [Candidatus Binatia bacterium]|jgi:branched-chain amino acid aminotransferase|nr:aminotransferase class IV [Candidatus Binatia bacterium]